jgi:glucosyl-3-phosphoglycerate synthase
VDDLLSRKGSQRVTVVLPARDEEQTVGGVVTVLAPLVDAGLVDDLVVLDSLSTDRTSEVATAAGARVVRADEAWPHEPALRGKGEAMWRALLATEGDVVAYCDADLLDAGPHYVTGLLGPLLTNRETLLVKGFYDRPLVGDDGSVTGYGGRVTELVARPLLGLYRPELAGLVQPLAGEWAGRRTLLESLPFPTGYGVEIAVLLDTVDRHGVDALAQVDLGTRTHRQQSQDALGVMATEVLGTAMRRFGREPEGTGIRQFTAVGHHVVDTDVALRERPPAADVRAAAEGQSA